MTHGDALAAAAATFAADGVEKTLRAIQRGRLPKPQTKLNARISFS